MNTSSIVRISERNLPKMPRNHSLGQIQTPPSTPPNQVRFGNKNPPITGFATADPAGQTVQLSRL